MPFDGSGNYIPPAPPVFPAITATTISSSYYNTLINDIGAALTSVITRGGQSPATGNIPFGGFRLTGLGLATAATDAASLDQVNLSEQSVNLLQFGWLGDGSDHTTCILNAQTYARAKGIKKYIFPAGLFRWTSALIWQTGELIQGQGDNITLGYKTFDGQGMTFGDWGNGASSFYGGGMRNMTLYHDYGTGLFPPTTGVPTNPTTTGSLIRIWQPTKAYFQAWLIGGYGVCDIWGGTDSDFTIQVQGVWDPTSVPLQMTAFGIKIDGSLTAIPTTHRFSKCGQWGAASASRVTSWPGGFSVAVINNIGPLIGYDIRCCEGLNISEGYIGSAAKYGVSFKPSTGTILRDVHINGTFVDAAAVAAFSFDNTNGLAAENIVIKPVCCSGQGNGLFGITDQDSNLTNYSVINLIVDTNFATHVGNAINLKRAAMVDIRGIAKTFNCYNFYTGNAGGLGYDCAVRLADNNQGVTVAGTYGGGGAGTGGAYDNLVIRYTSAGNPARLTQGTIALGVGVTLSASL